MKKKYSLEIIIFLIIILFIYAAVAKVSDFEAFKAQLGKSPLIMPFYEIIAYGVPSSEILIVLMLLSSRSTLIGLYGAFTLMFAFTAYIAFVLTLSPYVPCSCGGVLNKLGWTEHLIFNITFTVLAYIGIVLQSRKGQDDYILSNPAASK